MKMPIHIGMSGGVDSSVAAYILHEQGYDVTGFTMQLCGNEDITAARSVADKIGIKFETFDRRSDFRKCVIENFVDTYADGHTPNPCIECNRCIKFNIPGEIATGHYAIVEQKDGRWCLRKSTNLDKDQSYFLYTLSQNTLARVHFPLGNMTKEEVRHIADEQHFVNAHKKDSQDICFIEDGDYAGFIEEYTGRKYAIGYFVDTDGNVLGKHKGIIKYTIGQRKGLGLALKKPMYVSKLDIDKNEVVLDDNAALFSTELSADNFNWVSIGNPHKEFRALGRVRYRHCEAPCTVFPESDGSVRVVFDEPQRAITAGQSLVLYDCETDSYVLGGGIIK